MKRETNSDKSVSFAWTIQFLLLMSGPPKFRVRDTQDLVGGSLDFALIAQIAVWLFAGLWIAWDLRKNPLPLRKSIHGTVLLFFLALLLSLTKTKFVALTAFKLYQIAITILFIVCFVRKFGASATLAFLSKSCLLLSALITAGIVFLPDIVIPLSETGFPRLRGWGIADAHVVSSIALLLLLCGYPRMNKWISLLLAAWLSGLLFLSLTRAAWAGFAVSVLLAMLIRPKIWSLNWLRASCIAAMLIFVSMGVEFFNQFRDQDSLYELSDRAFLWGYLAEQTSKHSPYLGLGYFSASRVLAAEWNPDYGTAHSIFMESFVGAGAIGLGAFVLLIAAMSIYAFQIAWKRDDAFSFALISLWPLLIITGMFGSELDSTPFSFTFWLLCVLLAMFRPGRSMPSAWTEPSLQVSPIGTI